MLMRKGKKLFELLLLCVPLTLAACGKSEKPEPKKDVADVTEAPESTNTPMPLPNALIREKPLPADSGELELTKQEYPQFHLNLNLPEGTEGSADEKKAVVTDKDGIWEMEFQPFQASLKSTIVSNIENEYSYDGETVFPDRDDMDATIQGYDAHIYSTNIKENWIDPESGTVPAVDIVVDYGNTLVGQWNGLWIHLISTEYEEHDNIYDIYRSDPVLAVLNHFEIVPGDSGNTVSVGGITVTFPSRWKAMEGTFTGPWASIEDEDLNGAVYVQSQTPADPAQAAKMISDESFTKTYGDKEYLGVMDQTGDETKTYSLKLFREFSEERCLGVTLTLFGLTEEEIRAFADGEVFTDIMNSIEIDPTGFVDPDKGTDDTGYIRNNDGVLIGYDGSGTELVIPPMVSGMEIVGIDEKAFSGNTKITSVVLPDTLTYLDVNAFQGCTALQNVSFPSSLTYIGPAAFEDCTALKDVEIPASVETIEQSAFSNAGAGSFAAEGAVTYGYGSLQNSGFDRIKIGADSDLSEGYIFANAKAAEILLGGGITKIGERAFSGCENLTQLILPATVTELGAGAFASTPALRRLELPEGITELPSDVFWSTGLHVLIVPESVTMIKERAILLSSGYVCLKNPAVTLENSAMICDFLYLDGVYDTGDVPDNLESQEIYTQVYLAMDASLEESGALDDYLESIGMDRIAWIGTAPQFLDPYWEAYIPDDHYLAEYTGDSTELLIPDRGGEDMISLWWIKEGAFENSDLTTVVFYGNINSIETNAFSGSGNLKDLWFTAALLRWVDDEDGLCPDCLSGLPEDVTVHLPACLTEEQRSHVEGRLKESGLAETTVFDYYSFREE